MLLDSEICPDPERRIAGDGALVAELRGALPALKAVAEHKAGEDGVRAVIGRRLVTFPQPQRTEGEWAAWWADYVEVLSDVTLASLEAGMRAYVALPDSEFMPKPGRLRELAFTAPSRTLRRLYRAQHALRIADAPPMPPAEAMPPTIPVDPAEVKQWLADFKAGQKVAKDQSRLPSIAGKPDHTGITPQMREILARQT